MNTHAHEIRVACQREPFTESVKFWAYMKDCLFRAQPLEFKVMKPEDEGMIAEPFMKLQDGAAQQFMDALWREGFRPTEGKDNSGALAATERHLADLQKLVFKSP